MKNRWDVYAFNEILFTLAGIARNPTFETNVGNTMHNTRGHGINCHRIFLLWPKHWIMDSKTFLGKQSGKRLISQIFISVQLYILEPKTCGWDSYKRSPYETIWYIELSHAITGTCGDVSFILENNATQLPEAWITSMWKWMLGITAFQTWHLIGWQHNRRSIKSHVEYPWQITWILTWNLLSILYIRISDETQFDYTMRSK